MFLANISFGRDNITKWSCPLRLRRVWPWLSKPLRRLSSLKSSPLSVHFASHSSPKLLILCLFFLYFPILSNFFLNNFPTLPNLPCDVDMLMKKCQCQNDEYLLFSMYSINIYHKSVNNQTTITKSYSNKCQQISIQNFNEIIIKISEYNNENCQ